MNKRKRIYYIAAAGLALLYYAGEATGLQFPAMLIILPIGCWILWHLRPHEEKPSD